MNDFQKFELWRKNGFSPDEARELVNCKSDWSVGQLAELILVQMRHDRKRGRKADAADYLSKFPALATNKDNASILLYEQFLAENEQNPSLSISLFSDKFPAYRQSIELQHSIFKQSIDLNGLNSISIQRLVGRGTYGLVYLGRQNELNRNVAIKILDTRFESFDTKRFERESQVIASLNSNNIVQIYTAGKWNGHFLQVLEFMNEGSLRDKLQAVGKMEPRVAARVVLEACRGVQAAHEAKICHRDLKPDNILLNSEGAIKVADFGLAVAEQYPATHATAMNVTLGTPGYQAPELVNGEVRPIREQSDVYSLGVILFELVTGELPLGSLKELPNEESINDVPKSLRELVPAAPLELAQICNRCLRKLPSNRYPNAAAMADDLDRFLRGERIVGGKLQVSSWSDRFPTRVALAKFSSMIVGALLIVFAVLLWQQSRTNQFAASLTRHEQQLRTAFKPLQGAVTVRNIEKNLADLRRLAIADDSRKHDLTIATSTAVSTVFREWIVEGYSDASRMSEEEYEDAQEVIEWLAQYDLETATNSQELLQTSSRWPISSWTSGDALVPLTQAHADPTIANWVASYESPENRVGIKIDAVLPSPKIGESWSLHFDGLQPKGLGACIVPKEGMLTIPLLNGEVAKVDPVSGRHSMRIGSLERSIQKVLPTEDLGTLILYSDGSVNHHQGGGTMTPVFTKGSGLIDLSVSPSLTQYALVSSMQDIGTLLLLRPSPAFVDEQLTALAAWKTPTDIGNNRYWNLPMRPKQLVVADSGDCWVLVDGLGVLKASYAGKIRELRTVMPSGNSVTPYLIGLGPSDTLLIACENKGNDEIRLYDQNTCLEKGKLSVNDCVTAFAFSRLESRFVFGDSKGATHFIGLLEGKWKTQFTKNTNKCAITGITIDSVSNLCVCSAIDGDHSVWKIEGNDLKLRLVAAGRLGTTLSSTVHADKTHFRLVRNGRLVDEAEYTEQQDKYSLVIVQESQRIRIFVNELRLMDHYADERSNGSGQLHITLPSKVPPPEVLSIKHRADSALQSLESADRLFEKSDSTGALEIYIKGLDRALSSRNFREQLECRMGIARCLEVLERTDESIEVLGYTRPTPPSTADDLVALESQLDFYRWFLLSRKSIDLDDCQRTFHSLQESYTFGPSHDGTRRNASQFVSLWMRNEICNHYAPREAIGSQLFQLNPKLLASLHSRSQVAWYLNVELSERLARDIDLFEAASMAGDIGEVLAMETGRRMKEHLPLIMSGLDDPAVADLAEEVIVKCSWMQRLDGNAKESQEWLQNVAEQNPEFIDQCESLKLEQARVAFALGDIPACREILLRFVDANPQTNAKGIDLRPAKRSYGYWAQAHLMLGCLSYSDNNQEAARKWWQRGSFDKWQEAVDSRVLHLHEENAMSQIYHCGLRILSEPVTLTSLAATIGETNLGERLPDQFRVLLKALSRTNVMSHAILAAIVRLYTPEFDGIVERAGPILANLRSANFHRLVNDFAFRKSSLGELYRRVLSGVLAEAILTDLRESKNVEIREELFTLVHQFANELIASPVLFEEGSRSRIKQLIMNWLSVPELAVLEQHLKATDQIPMMRGRMLFLFSLVCETTQHEKIRGSAHANAIANHDDLLLACLEYYP